MPQIPAGWYDDPSGAGGYRWWDGGAWTSNVATSPGAPPPGPPGKENPTLQRPAVPRSPAGGEPADARAPGWMPPGSNPSATDAGASPARRRGPALLLLAAVALVLLGGGAAFALYGPLGGNTVEVADDEPRVVEPTQREADDETVVDDDQDDGPAPPEPVEEPTPERTTRPEPPEDPGTRDDTVHGGDDISVAELEEGLRSYLRALDAGDVDGAHAHVSPELRQQSGWSYDRFAAWSETITGTRVVSIDAVDPTGRRVDATVDYELAEGGASRESIRTTFVRGGGGLLLDGYEVLSSQRRS
jgi:hypothetical protein